MIKKARSFSDAEIFHPGSAFRFETHVEQMEIRSLIDRKDSHAQVTIINCSYLFASKTLDVKMLSDQLRKIENVTGSFYVLYQNPVSHNKNSNWTAFQAYFDLISVYSADRSIYYFNRRSITATRKEEKVRFEIAKIITYDYAV